MRTVVVLALVLAISPCGARAADEDLQAQGLRVFQIGGCANCHTAKDGPALAGGDPLVTPFGTFHPPNITPDKETGIGGWTLAQFTTALREGRAPDGSPYYPAFPYTSYTRMTDGDIAALKAYLDSVPAVKRTASGHDLAFPYNIRPGLYLWQYAFMRPGPYTPDTARDAAWNRGAYLVQGPGHCTECHTPRTWTGALDRDRAFAGGPAPTGKGRIPNISGDAEHGLGKWSIADITTVLSSGMTPKGDFLGGEMGRVIDNGTGKLPPEDVQAIAVYLKSLPGTS